MKPNFRIPLIVSLLSSICGSAIADPLTYHYRQHVPGVSASVLMAAAPATAVLEKLSPAATSLDFGSVAVGTTGQQVITLKNGAPAGGNPLTVTTAGLTGVFSVLANTCTTVPAQDTCSIAVGYSPSTTGAAPGQTLQLTPSEGLALALSTQGSGTGDPYWSYVTALYKYDVNLTSVANSKTANPGYGLYNAIYTANGKFGGGGVTNGTSYMYGNTNAFYPTGSTPFAVETWVKLTGSPAITASGTFQGATIFSREGDGSDVVLYFARWPVLAGGAPNHVCLNWDNWVGGSRSAYYCASTPIGLNEWHHVAVSYSGSGMPMLFLDGNLLSGSGSNPTNLPIGVTTAGAGGLSFGWRNAAEYNGFLTGVFDDSRITVGVQRYTTSFQPPSVALPAY